MDVQSYSNPVTINVTEEETTEEEEEEEETRGRNIYGAHGRCPKGSIYVRLHHTFGNKDGSYCPIKGQSCYNQCYAETETRGRNIYGAQGWVSTFGNKGDLRIVTGLYQFTNHSPIIVQ